MTPAPTTIVKPLMLGFKPLSITIRSDFDLPRSVEKLAAASARFAEDVRIRALPQGHVSAFSVSLRLIEPFLPQGSGLQFDGHFEQRESGVVLTGRFKPFMPLGPWVWIVLLLYPIYLWWPHLPPLFDGIAITVAYAMVAGIVYHFMWRPARRRAADRGHAKGIAM